MKDLIRLLIRLLILSALFSLACNPISKTREPDRSEDIVVHMNNIQLPESFRAGLIIYDTIANTVVIKTYTCYLQQVSSPSDSTYLTGTAHLTGNITLPIKE